MGDTIGTIAEGALPMHSYIALPRAANVGGTGKLPMSDLLAMCRDAGFTNVKTYIASGNVLFQSAAMVKSVKHCDLISRKDLGAVLRCHPGDQLARRSLACVDLAG